MRNQAVIISIMALFLVSVLALSGCDSEMVYSNQGSSPLQQQTQEQTLPVQTIGDIYLLAKNWDADPEIDGLEFSLTPADSNGNMVKSPGHVSAKLWKAVTVGYESKCLKRDSDLLESWNNVLLNEENYGFMGATIRLEYTNYKVTDNSMAMGCVEVTFTTPDGKSFKSYEDSVFINGL